MTSLNTIAMVLSGLSQPTVNFADTALHQLAGNAAPIENAVPMLYADQGTKVAEGYARFRLPVASPPLLPSPTTPERDRESEATQLLGGSATNQAPWGPVFLHASPVDLGELVTSNSNLAQSAEPPVVPDAPPSGPVERAVPETSRETEEPIEEQPNQQQQLGGFEIALPALLDGRYIGDISVRVSGDIISFGSDRLLTMLKPDFTQEALSDLSELAVDGRLTVGQFAVEGLDVSYNRQLQQIEVTSVSSLREVTVIESAYRFDRSDAGSVEPANFSFFATPTVTSEYVWEAAQGLADGFRPLRGTVDIGGRVGGEKGVAFLSRHSFQTGSNGGVSREETQLIYDILPRVMRMVAGDLRARGTSFQNVPSMAGLSVERFFELEPNRLFRPVGQSTFELERPSTVEVRINGVVQREIFLQPGRYDLRDLPLIQGSNLVDLVIRDDTGRERIISDRNFFDFDLLEEGITDFSLALGVKSSFGDRAPEYSNDPVITGFARRGISSNVTAGFDLQADESGANGGLSVLWASPIGIWRLKASGSQRKSYGAGFAGEAGYSTTGQFGGGWRWTTNASAQFFSSDFATVSDDPRGDTFIGPPVNQSTASIFNASVQMTGPRWSINAGASHSQGRAGRANTSSMIAGANYSLNSTWSAGLFARYTDDGLAEDKAIVFQLAWRPARNTDVRARYDTSNNEAEIRYRKSAPQGVGSLNYGLNAIRNGDQDSFDLSGDAFYTGNRFEGSLRHDVTSDASFGSQRTQRSQITLGTSLVFAGGKLAVSRPVRNAFAIVSPHETLKGKEIRIDPSESGYSAKTDFLGPAVSVDVTPFARRAIYADVLDLPPGYDLGSGQFAMRAPLYGGYNLTLGSGASFTVLGKVTDAETGEPLVYLGGRMESLDDASAEPIPAFTNRNGRLAATGLKPGRYKIILFTDPEYTQEIVIPEDGPSLIDIGQVKVELP